MTPAPNLDLPIGMYVLSLTAETPVSLPEFAGSTWRGAFGHALKQSVCVMDMRACAGCTLEATCPYPVLFTSPAPDDASLMSRYERVPQPYVLRPPLGARDLAPGESYTMEMRLFGTANRLRQVAIQALARTAQTGVGKGRGRLRLSGMTASTGETDWPPTPPIDPAPSAVTITFETPLRLKRKGRLLGADDLTARDVLDAAVRRISGLMRFHANGPPAVDFRALKASMERARLTDRDLRWHDWARWSGRQKAYIQLGGLVGSLQLDLSECPDVWPFLALAAETHLGKAATMGLGRITLHATAACSPNGSVAAPSAPQTA